MALCAIFAALIFIPTAYLHIPVGTGQYIHFGDAIIYISACVLNFPLGAVAGAVGGGLADILSGYGYWAPFTAVIKFFIALTLSSKSEKILTFHNGVMSVLSGCISTFGYYLSTVVIMAFGIGGYEKGSSLWGILSAAAIDSLPGSAIQSVGSVIIFIILAAALDKANFKNSLKIFRS